MYVIESSEKEKYKLQWNLVDTFIDEENITEDIDFYGPVFDISTSEIEAMRKYYSIGYALDLSGEHIEEFSQEYPDLVDLAKSGASKLARRHCIAPLSIGLE